MEALFWALVLPIVLGTVIFWRLSLPLAAAVLGVCLVAFTVGTEFLFAQIFFWLLYLIILVPLNIPAFRRDIVSREVLKLFKSVMPPMSQTEREALEAGTVWWDGDLFSGDPSWEKLRAIPKPVLTSEERAFLDGPTEQLCQMLDDWEINHERHDLPPEAWDFLKREKFFGMIIPKEYGGLDFSAYAHSQVVMKVASRSMAAAVTVMVPNSLGPAELLHFYGTDEQKNHYLPKLATGEEVPCFALTSPHAGSDAASIPDKGIIQKGIWEGEEVLGMSLTFDKRYITLSPVATVAGLAFHLHDPDHLFGDVEDLGITVGLLPTSVAGVDVSRRHDPLGIGFMNGTVRGADVFVPLDFIIGGTAGIGKGWKMLMERLAIGRSISLPALSVAGAKRSSRSTGAYARVRRQFRLPIGKFEGVAEKLAIIAGSTYLMEAVRTMTVGAVDEGERPAVVSAMAKYNLTERLRLVINAAMDVHGGSGISFGPRNIVGLPYSALPIAITVEGANILTRTLIVFGQGAIRCHPYVLKEMEAASDTNDARALDSFDSAVFGHIGFTLSNTVRTLFYGLTGARLGMGGGGALKRYYLASSRITAIFTLTADVVMGVFGGGLKRKEMISGRLADAFSNLYMATAVLKRYEDDGRPEGDWPLVQWSMETALHEAQNALIGVFDNIPIRIVGWKLKALAFPWGRSYSGPSDRLSLKVASLIMEPSETRDRLTADIHKPSDAADPVGRMEDAMLKVIAAEPIEKILREAVKKGEVTAGDETTMIDEALTKGVLTHDQGEALKAASLARLSVITVDDFPLDFESGSAMS